MTRPVRIGMIVPSSNTCLEPQTARILGAREDVTVHSTRIEVTRIVLDADSDTQFDHAAMVDAARLLRTADVDVVAWNGTAGSWLGAGHDREMVRQITAATGVPATTSTLAYLDAFARFGLERIGLVTPYTADVNQAVATAWATEGIEVVAERHVGLHVNEEFARVPPEDLVPLAHDVVEGGRAQAVAYLCTNLYGAPVVERVEAETATPVLDSVAVTLWRCLDMVGAPLLDPRWGRLLGGPAAA
ncbi:aspartate/glutamate racemase family protein [Isoptericola sp. NPDC019693]|uniref:maleate cis-trans isomerase family protein n=1 Tax=Isoptericola sp. NPDC019693 TaxID=3364009 RepID=UPI003799DAAF